MAKLTLTDISGSGSTEAINANNALIEAAIENTVSRDGTTPNMMDADFDMNSYDINNVGTTRTAALYINGQRASIRPFQGSFTLDEIEDVNITAPIARHALMYDGVDSWDNRLLVEADISDLGTYLEDITAENLTELADVVITTPAEGQALTYDSGSGNWINGVVAGSGSGGGGPDFLLGGM